MSSVRTTGPSQARVVQSHEVAATRFLALHTLEYRDQTGRQRKWDMVRRRRDRAELHGDLDQDPAHADAVAVLAVLHSEAYQGDLHTVLVRQFRPPLDTATLELPAGLIDPGETPSQAAERELCEETGLVGTAAFVSAPLCLSPGWSDERCRLVVVHVDLDSPANVAPRQCAHDAPHITVVPTSLRTLGEFVQSSDSPVFAGVYMLAQGILFGSRGRFGAH